MGPPGYGTKIGTSEHRSVGKCKFDGKILTISDVQRSEASVQAFVVRSTLSEPSILVARKLPQETASLKMMKCSLVLFNCGMFSISMCALVHRGIHDQHFG